MLYRKFGKTNIRLSALGIGTMRLKVSTMPNIDCAIGIIKCALNAGVNYIDTSYGYLGGQAELIVREALKQTNKEVYVTVKVAHNVDTTASACYKRVCDSLTKMELRKATFFIIWRVSSYDEFLKIIEKGGLYDGAIRAKKDGLVDYICASVHAPPQDIVKIMDAGLLDGLTISYSLLNCTMMQPVLDKAERLDIGIITMNSLGGGIIPQNSDYFVFSKQKTDETVIEAALRYSYAHLQISTLLSGITTMEELQQNIGALSITATADEVKTRIDTVNKCIINLDNYCTGCNYCNECPQGINISELMYSYNAVMFDKGIPNFKRTDKRLVETLRIFYNLNRLFNYLPLNANNPCIKCGKCESKCTQKLSIIKTLEDIYRRFDDSGYNQLSIHNRIIDLFSINYSKIAFYPAGNYTKLVLEYIFKLLSNIKTKFFIFDKNKSFWDTDICNIKVNSPDIIPQIHPEIIIISNYMYQDEIYNSLKNYENDGIKVIKLHKPTDVPWQF